MKPIFCTLLLLVASIGSADEPPGCQCNRCGCKAQCRKVCHVVCDMKDVKVTCYGCRSEDVCIPGPSKKCGEVCEPNPCCLARPADCDCRSGGSCRFGAGCCECTLQSRTIWEPACSADIRTVNKLIKYEVTKKVPTYKWVVEYCCDQCCCEITDEARRTGAQTAAASRTADAPSATLGETKLQAPSPPPQRPLAEPSQLRPADQPERLQPKELKSDDRQGVVHTSHNATLKKAPWSYLFK